LSRLAGAIGTRRRRRATHPRRVDRERRRMLGEETLTERERNVLERVDPHVDPADAMHAGDSAHYLSVGLSAIGCIDAAGVTDPRRILDLPCGHGRVLRALAAAFPGAELTACDLDRHGAGFCAAQFGAAPVYASRDVSDLALPGGFDLIWCGSLATHLGAGDTRALLERLGAALAPGGTLVITTHGHRVAGRLADGEADYQLTPEGIRELLEGYRETGFGYADYAWSPGYGVSVMVPDWLAAPAGLERTYLAERAWDDHQDVHAFTRGS
jgi:SAM-dependent methyltransferase